jgi:hypothetical protein
MRTVLGWHGLGQVSFYPVVCYQNVKSYSGDSKFFLGGGRGCLFIFLFLGCLFLLYFV